MRLVLLGAPGAGGYACRRVEGKLGIHISLPEYI